MLFDELGFSPNFLKVLKEKNFNSVYPIQEQAIPPFRAGEDLLGIAPTGSGKTASYVLPLLERLAESTPGRNRHVDALILVPTRELAIQVQGVVQSFMGALSEPIKSMAVYGGVSVNTQMMALQGVRILVATPGRLLDLIDSNSVHLDSVHTLVLDEADKILNIGFKSEVDKIMALLPERRQNLLFSATLNQDIQGIKDLMLHNPVIVNVQSGEMDETLIKQTVYAVSEVRKGPFLRYLIKSRDIKQVLVFTSSVQRAERVATKLNKNGIHAEPIHSKKSQGIRRDILEDFKLGIIRVLVTTDLLARGIDIEVLPIVINYELPRSPKVYIHRIGRTGRAGAWGEAITLITPDDEAHFRVIENKMKSRIPRTPTDDVNLHGF